MRVEDYRLRIIVADHAYSDVALEFVELILELGSEIRVLDAVDTAAEAVLFPVEGGHTGSAGAEMRVVVNAIKQFIPAGMLGCCSEKTSHRNNV